MDFLFTLFAFIFVAVILYHIVEFLKDQIYARSGSTCHASRQKRRLVARILLQTALRINPLPIIFYLKSQVAKD